MSPRLYFESRHQRRCRDNNEDAFRLAFGSIALRANFPR